MAMFGSQIGNRHPSAVIKISLALLFFFSGFLLVAFSLMVVALEWKTQEHTILDSFLDFNLWTYTL